jgi:hypothetical protein
MTFIELKPGLFLDFASIESVNTNDNTVITKSGNLHTLAPETCAEVLNAALGKKKTEKPEKTEK